MQQQSMFNAAQCVLVCFLLACSLLMTIVVNMYIEHRLYHRCFYHGRSVEVRTSLVCSFFFSWREFLLCFFFIVNEYVCLNFDALICKRIK